MEITGKIVKALPLQTGQGKNGVWKKQEYILETPSDKFPKKVCVAVWGDNIERFGITEGNTITGEIDIESREYNGRWYTDVRIWKLSVNDSASGASAPSEPMSSHYAGNDPGSIKGNDDLPF